jgi:hypothetical protein
MCPMRAPKDQKSEDNQYEDKFCKIRHLTLNGRAPKGGAQLTAPHEALVGEGRRSSSLYPEGRVWYGRPARTAGAIHRAPDLL